MRKRMLAILLSLAMLICLLPVGVFADDNVIEVASDTDLASAITTASETTGAVIKLTTDITLPSDWTPLDLGAYGSTHNTVFDGQGHTVTLSGTPLFKGFYASNVVKNLKLEGSIPTTASSDQTGAIAKTFSGEIINCISYVAVSSTGSYKFGSFGGLVGWMYSGSITNSAVLGTAPTKECSYSSIGAIAGGADGGTVSGCYWAFEMDADGSGKTTGTNTSNSTETVALTAINTANAADSTLVQWTVPAEAAGSVEVSFTVFNKGEFAKDNDNKLMYQRPVTVSDLNTDGKLTLDEALVAMHKAYHAEDGYATETSSYGGSDYLSVTKLWGVTTYNSSYYRNGMTTNSVDAEFVEADDQIVISLNQGSYPDTDRYSFFTVDTTTAIAGTAFDLTLQYSGYDANWAPANFPVKDAQIGYYNMETGAFTALTGVTTDENGKASITLDAAGTYYISAKASSGDSAILLPAICVVTVDPAPEAPKLNTLEFFGSDLVTGLAPTFDPAVYSGYSLELINSKTSMSIKVTASAGCTVTASVNGSTAKVLDTTGWDSLDFTDIWGSAIPVEIVVTNAADKTTTYLLSVKHMGAPATSVEINRDQLPLIEGASETLTAVVNPQDAADQTVIWTTDNEAVATVDENGKVTAVAEGTVPITATAANGVKDTCTVTVTKASSNTLSGTGAENDPYLLENAEDFDVLDALVSEGETFAGKFFKVTADITLNEGWNGIGLFDGTTVYPFSGTLNGDGHALTFPAGSAPLFDSVREATITNFKIKSDFINGNGLIANYRVDSAYACANISKVTILSGTKIAGSGFISGYASGSNVVTISDCHIESGVILGCGKDGNSLNASNIGGFGGDFNGTVTNSTCAATIYGKDFVGGIIGGQGQSMSKNVIFGCTFSGKIIATGNYVGGIAGSGYTGTQWGTSSAPNATCITIKDCIVPGEITGKDYVGGILGAEPGVVQCWENGIGTITGNKFTGKLTSDGEYVGGIIGYLHSINRYNVISGNQYNYGCGADKGIGGAKYVDTSLENPTAVESVTYVDTSKGNPDISGMKKDGTDFSRTDDPLGADASKLAKMVGAPVNAPEPDNPKTGDESHLLFWAALLLASAMSMAALVPMKKRCK